MIKRDQAYALNRVRAFSGTIMDAPGEVLDMLTLVLTLTHVKNISPNVPYVLAQGEAESGKSTLTKDLPMLLASNVFLVDRLSTSDAVRNRFLDRTPPDTLPFDDASKIWGPSGRQSTTNVATQLAVNSYADTGRVSVSRGGTTVEAPAYCVCFFNGLGDVLPNDVATRCIKVRLVKRSDGARRMRGAMSAPVRLEAEPLKAELHRWANSKRREMAQWLIENGHRIHPLLNDRLLQLWGPLFTIAHAAGGDWPGKCLNAFLSLGLDEAEKPVLQRDEQALLDTARIAVAKGVRTLFAADLVPELRKADAFYRKTGTDDLITLLVEVLGEPEEARDRTMEGKRGAGLGWSVAPVLIAAKELRESLQPERPETGQDRVQRYMTLREVR